MPTDKEPDSDSPTERYRAPPRLAGQLLQLVIVTSLIWVTRRRPFRPEGGELRSEAARRRDRPPTSGRTRGAARCLACGVATIGAILFAAILLGVYVLPGPIADNILA